MNILITGAAGFLGRNFALHHLAKGDQVFGIDDLSNPHSHWPPGLVEKLKQDAYEYFRWAKDGLSWDVLYHFAAPVGGRERIERDPLFNADSLRLDAEMFRWAVRQEAKPIVVYPSSSAVYGVWMQEGATARVLQEGDQDLSKTAYEAPDEMYGFTKLAGERLAMASARYGLNTLCIRPFSGYGEGQGFDYPVPSIARRAVLHEDPLQVWGPGNQTRDFVHIEDLVGATVARLEADVLGYQTMNIASGVETSFSQVAAICAEISGYSPDIANVVTKPSGVARRVGSPTRMRSYYTPRISLEEGLRRVMEWIDQDL
jgi:nucleoside-diphosphate-sugar epimerase